MATSNLWSVLFLVFAGQGIFFSVVLFSHKSAVNKANRFLAVLLFLFSLNLIENVGYWTRFLVNIPHAINTTSSFLFLYGPLFYLYVSTRITDRSEINFKSIVHLLPFLAFNLYMLNYYTLSAEIKAFSFSSVETQADFWTYFWQSLSVLQLGLYSFLSFKCYQRHKIKDSILKNSILAFTIFSAVMFLYYALVHLVGLSQRQDYLISLLVAIIIYQIGYAMIVRPGFFNPLFNKRKSLTKYAKSGLSISEGQKLIQKIKTYIEKDKLYLDGDLRISHLAEPFDVSTNIISQVINEHTGFTFLEFINRYRVEEACRLLSNGRASTLTLLGVAFESGFNNKTSFNKSFKKYTGQTPKEYRLTCQA